jgi:hypothetical protein
LLGDPREGERERTVDLDVTELAIPLHQSSSS